jgi:hypothetical protein
VAIAKVQHYVPQFLLKKFGNGKKDQLFVYDKQCDRVFSTNVKNIACESRFYDFEFNSSDLTIEPALSRLESDAKPLIDRILKQDTLSCLNPEDRAVLSIFLSIQFTRTRTFREQWSSFPSLLREHFTRHNEPPENLTEISEYLRDPTDNETKLETARFMLNSAEEFSTHFANKTWILAQTTRSCPFIISDNPIVLQNMIDMGPRGNLGLAVRGIEIYFPLTPTRALAMWCPSHEETIREGMSELKRKMFLGPQVQEMYFKNHKDLIRLATAIENGTPLAYKKENVENFNSLQIASSERFIFSSKNDFQLAKEMILSEPKLRSGPRMECN